MYPSRPPLPAPGTAPPPYPSGRSSVSVRYCRPYDCAVPTYSNPVFGLKLGGGQFVAEPGDTNVPATVASFAGLLIGWPLSLTPSDQFMKSTYGTVRTCVPLVRSSRK